jgi:hypothetical protein
MTANAYLNQNKLKKKARKNKKLVQLSYFAKRKIKHLSSYVEQNPRAKIGRERQFLSEKRNKEHVFDQWKYTEKDKLFKLQHETQTNQIHRMSEPQKYQNDHFILDDVSKLL